MRILVIEDEKKTAAFLAKGLREAGFAVDLALDGEAGLAAARASRFDLLIVDIMLPKKDGWALVEELRAAKVQTPVIFLTARDGVRDRVKGLELGAEREQRCLPGFGHRQNPAVDEHAAALGEVVPHHVRD